jgi:glycosyltransferase involved in cell wall biosynthesis
MFGWEFPPHNSGGLGTACFGLVRALSKLGAKVSFVLPKKMAVSSDFCKMVFPDEGGGSVDFYTIDSPLQAYMTSEEYLRANGAGKNGIYGSNLFQEVERYGRQAAAIAKKEKFDVIHAHDWLSFKAGVTAKRVSKKPLVAHVHATEFDRTGGRNLNEQVYQVEREGVAAADHVVAVSHLTKKMIESGYSVPAHKVSVVHNGVDAQEYNHMAAVAPMLHRLKKKGNSIVLFAGRITLQKGPDYFVKLAERVLQKNKKVYFVVSGSGDMEGKMLQDVAYRGLSKHFIFTGFLRGEEFHQVYRAADVYVMCSVSEPFGLIPLESILCGAPVLISKQTGVGEILNHALKSDFWDIDDMADKVLAVLKHPSLKKELLSHSTREAKATTWEKAAQKCLDLYQGLVVEPVYN